MVISNNDNETVPLERVQQFQQALVTFTPRLVVLPAIVLANIGLFAAMIAAGVHVFLPEPVTFIFWGANFGPKTVDGQWWRLMTSMFLHFGILHIGFNMWVLWGLGRLMERLVGNIGFFLLYFISGIAGSIASLAWNPDLVSAGASGAVFGVGGALLGLLLRQHDTIPIEALVPLRNSMITFLIYNLLFGLFFPGIDMAAHVGGLIAGFFCGLALSQPLSKQKIPRRRQRNLAVFAGGILVLPLAAYSLPDAPPDFLREMEQFAVTEQRILARYDALAQQVQKGEITDERRAAAIEGELLAPWKATRQRVEEARDAPLADQAFVDRLVVYMKTREAAWQLQLEGLREQDDGKVAQGIEKLGEADAMASGIQSTE